MLNNNFNPVSSVSPTNYKIVLNLLLEEGNIVSGKAYKLHKHYLANGITEKCVKEVIQDLYYESLKVGSEGFKRLLSEINLEEDTIVFNESIVETLNNIADFYIGLDTKPEYVQNLQNTLSIKLYEFLLNRENQNKTVELGKVREILGVFDKYRGFGQLNQVCLQPITEEIREMTPLNVILEYVTENKKVTDLLFKVI
jgi:plasmid replication initiation protein